MPLHKEQSHTETFDAGVAVRRAVLGDAYVDRSLSNMTEFNQALQELVSEYCWGTVWTREELGRRERSLINLSMMTALNRPHELALHLRGALNNGVTRTEIREVLLQSAIYCGVPAAIDAFRVAQTVFDEVDSDA